MPDTTNKHMHIHRSWIAGSKAHFLCRFRRWSEGGKGRGGGACAREGGWYKLQSPIYQFRPLDTNCSHLSAAGPVSQSAEWAFSHICSSLLRTSILLRLRLSHCPTWVGHQYINLLLEETIRFTNSTRRRLLLRRAENQRNGKKCLAQRRLIHHCREGGRLSPNQLCQHFLRLTAISCHCFLNQVMGTQPTAYKLLFRVCLILN